MSVKTKSATLTALVRFTEFSFTSSNRECIGRKGMWQEKLKTINFFYVLCFYVLARKLLTISLYKNVDIAGNK